MCLLVKSALGYTSAILQKVWIEGYFYTICRVFDVDNSDRSYSATQSNIPYKNVKKATRSRLFCKTAKRSVGTSLPPAEQVAA